MPSRPRSFQYQNRTNTHHVPTCHLGVEVSRRRAPRFPFGGFRTARSRSWELLVGHQASSAVHLLYCTYSVLRTDILRTVCKVNGDRQEAATCKAIPPREPPISRRVKPLDQWTSNGTYHLEPSGPSESLHDLDDAQRGQAPQKRASAPFPIRRPLRFH
jgi:hypothetical protein